MDSVKQENKIETHDLSEEISLGDLFSILNQYKKYLLSFSLIGYFLGVLISNTLQPTYSSEVTMISQLESGQASNSGLSGLASMAGINVGSSSSNNEAVSVLATLNSRSFLGNFIKAYNLKPDLHPELWNLKNNNWNASEPSDLSSVSAIKRMITFKKKESGLITFQVDSHSPDFSRDTANNIIFFINSYIRQQSIEEAERSITFLKKELESTNLAGIQKTIYSQIESHTQKKTLANVRDQYAYKIIDPAVSIISPSWPNKLQVSLLGLVIGMLLGIFVSLYLGLFTNKEE